MSPADATLHWVEHFVIHHGLCPFAARPFRESRVVAVTQGSNDVETCFNWALTQVKKLVETEPGKVETSLLVFPSALSEFTDFLDFVDTFEGVLDDAGATELVQLAHFHPDYQFAGVDYDDPGNGTNRSPFPVIQLLRVGSVAAAVAGYPHVEKIPERNVELLRNLAVS